MDKINRRLSELIAWDTLAMLDAAQTQNNLRKYASAICSAEGSQMIILVV